MLIVFCLVAPLLMILFAQRVPWADRIGVVPLVFLAGFVVALCANLTGMLPESSVAARQTLAEVSVALALPLIIFAANIHKVLRDARSALVAILAAFVSVVSAAMVGAVIFGGGIAQMPEVAGMSVGAYTGSGVNMGGVKTALGADTDLFLTMITYDIVFSSIYLVVVLVFGQRIVGLVLPPYQGADAGEDSDMAHLTDDSARGYARLWAREGLWDSVIALSAAIAVIGAALGLSKLAPGGGNSVVTILTITTLGLIGSLIPKLHQSRTSFHLGMYFTLVFCFTSATMMDAGIFARMDWAVGGYLLCVIFGSMVLQLVLCRILGVDRDTYLIASGAAVMSVPFIPVIAGALKNRALLIPGIGVAVIGYAVGNYLGVLVAGLVKAMGG